MQVVSRWLLFHVIAASKSVTPDQSPRIRIEATNNVTKMDDQKMRLQIKGEDASHVRRTQSVSRSMSEKKAMCKSCYVSVFLHIAKTGGSFNFGDMGFSPTRSILIMNLARLQREVMSIPSPELAENRRLSIVIHGQVHHDGCLTHNVTLPWVMRVSNAYRAAGCTAVVWTFLREPVSHFISAFRWYNFGFRQIDMRKVAKKWQMLGHSLKPWAHRMLKVHRLHNEDETYMDQIYNFMTTKIAPPYLSQNNSHRIKTHHKRTHDTTASSLLHSNLTIAEKQMLMLLYLADNHDNDRMGWIADTAFQSMRLLPLHNPLTAHVKIGLKVQDDSSGNLRYHPDTHCGDKTSWTQLLSTSMPTTTKSRNNVDSSLPSALASFDLIGLTELHGVALMQLAQSIGCPVDAVLDKCSNRANPARDKTSDPGAWSQDRLPKITRKLLRIAFADEMRLYNTVREQHWCHSSNLTSVIHQYAKICPLQIPNANYRTAVSRNGVSSRNKMNPFCKHTYRRD